MGVASRLLALGLLAVSACTVSAPPGGGGGGGGSDGVTGAFGGSGSHPSLGLTALAPSQDSALISWKADQLGTTPPNAALFIGTDLATLFSQAPLPVTVTVGQHLVTGLTENQLYHVGLGVESSPGVYLPVGPTLRMKPDKVIYANVNTPAAANDQDGETPATAFADPFLAMLTALAYGGGNVWLAEGDYPDVSLTPFEGVDLFGGFEPSFNLSARNAPGQETRFMGLANADVLRCVQGVAPMTPIVVDSLTIEGASGVENGVHIDTCPVELRGIVMNECGRGVKMRSSEDATPATIKVVDCEINLSRVEGLSIIGVFNVEVFGSDFTGNKNEGFDTGPLIAPAFEIIDISLVDCTFRDNGAEGVDLTLAAPVAPTGTGGSFDILIEDCDFVGNDLSGFFVDIDFETQPTWKVDVIVRGCYAAANRGSGLQFDVDSLSSTLVHRCLLSNNQGDGLNITSESHSGMVTASASAMVGNVGYGAQASRGNFALFLSHCIVAGNSQGGVRQTLVRGAAASSAAHLQSAPWQGMQAHFSLNMDGSTLPFMNAPTQYLKITSMSGATLNTSALPDFGIGTTCEVADDGTFYQANSVGVNEVTLAPKPAALPVPNRLSAFEGSTDVVEDYLPSPASLLFGAGMSFPGFPAEDCGPFGPPMGGIPGAEDLTSGRLFYVSETRPAVLANLGTSQELALLFNGGLPAINVAAGALRVTQGMGGAEVPVFPYVSLGEVRVPAPSGGWKPGMILEVHHRLQSVIGDSLTAPLALPVR
ncbi:MAG TPA: right-handed parallel beta-helix repeat-containing protein [Planctomycetes bacterium]|nr:right-handed parallel beta-helix repeat-containing protein [Planctomycetota bacterium]